MNTCYFYENMNTVDNSLLWSQSKITVVPFRGCILCSQIHRCTRLRHLSKFWLSSSAVLPKVSYALYLLCSLTTSRKMHSTSYEYVQNLSVISWPGGFRLFFFITDWLFTSILERCSTDNPNLYENVIIIAGRSSALPFS